MNKHQISEEAEDFLERVTEVSEQINKIMNNEIDITSELENQPQTRPKDIYKATIKKMDEEKKTREFLHGKRGHGEKDNYLYFCSKCLVEFLTESQTCFHCKGELITKDVRKAFLSKQVEELKKKKKIREERKSKWEMWKKTKAICRTNNSTDTQKWEYFTDSENSDEELEKTLPPVLPTDNPTFSAMEKDMNERADKMKKDAKKADELKIKGNEYFAKNDYFLAIEKYTEALTFDNNNKYIWLNRALARIKFSEFENAIDDCTKMIEYMEILENGFERSNDVAVKAFLRRAMAYKMLKDYSKAIQDCEKSIEVCQKGSIQENKDFLVELIRLEEERMIIEKNKNNEVLCEELKSMKNANLEMGFYCFEKLFFKMGKDKKVEIELTSNEVLMKQIKKSILNENLVLEILKKNSEVDIKMTIFEFCIKSIALFDSFLDAFIEYKILFQIKKKLSEMMSKFNDFTPENTIFIDQLLDLLVECAKKKNGRAYLLKSHEFMFDCFNKSGDPLKHHFQQSTIFFSLISLTTNLIYEEGINPQITTLKKRFFDYTKTWFISYLKKCSISKKNMFSYNISVLYSNLTNLVVNNEIRSDLVKIITHENTDFITAFNVLNLKCLIEFDYNSYSQKMIENQLNLVSNLLHDNQKTTCFQIFSQKNYCQFLEKILFEKSTILNEDVLKRIFNILSKIMSSEFNNSDKLLDFLLLKVIEKQFFCQSNEWIKILISTVKISDKSLLLGKISRNQKAIKIIINEINKADFQNVVLLNNSILLFSTILEQDASLAKNFIDVLEKLIFIVKEKTGVIRKTAAVLIAKMCQDKEILENARSLHATELLLNLQSVL